jgi:pilus assembly protein CpaF
VDNLPEQQSQTIASTDAETLVEKGVLTAQVLEFLRACIGARLNLAISGPEGSGKRALLHALVPYSVGDGEILAVQNPDEPSLERKGITVLKAHLGPDGEGPCISRQYLLSLVPKMHPTGLILDRVDGAEVALLLRLLFAMNGVMFSIVADSAAAALERLEELALAHEESPDSSLVRRMLSSGLDLVVQLGKVSDGSSTASSLTEVAEHEEHGHVLREIYSRERPDDSEASSDPRHPLRPTGAKPLFLTRMESFGISVPGDLFS